MASNRAFFWTVLSSATRGATAWARSSRSRVESPELRAVAISASHPLGRKISSNLTLQRALNRVRMPSVYDRHVNARFAGRLSRSQFGPHPSRPQLALAVAEIFHRRRQLAHKA